MHCDFTETVRRARQGDADAFGALYSTIYPTLYHVARCALRSPEDAADAVSDAVLDAFQSISHLKNEAAFRSWMFTILTAKIKRKQREYANIPAELTEANSPAVPFAAVNAELNAALAKLPDEDRLLLSLQVLGGYNGKELAKMFGGTASGIRSRLMRIRRKLRQDLSDSDATE